MLLLFKLSSGDYRIFLYCLSFAGVFIIGRGYNLNTVHKKVFTDPNVLKNGRASYFGFSTALFVTTNNQGRREASILVGAPRANSSGIPLVHEPGTVFNCGINDEDDNKCVEWNLDIDGNKPLRIGAYKINQFKNNAWTGANIGVSYNKPNYPKVVVCVPNWKFKQTPEHWPMIGMYYSSMGRDREIFKYPAHEREFPVKDEGKISKCKKYGRSLAQAGFSMHLYSEGDQTRFLLGSPGVADGTGFLILIEGSHAPIIPECIHDHWSIEGFDYFGYSVTSGIYHSNSTVRWYAAGAPRSKKLRGQVVVFRFNETDRKLIVPFYPDRNYPLRGTQIGEYFGGSVASCDVNNDEKDEIIVGAPFWSNEMDEGRIYVFSEDNKIFKKIQVIDGTKSGARFGTVVTCLGDLDKDGYKDIAVGAPYDGNHGAIYIYNGNKQGVEKKFSQRIFGESISTGIRGFGAAISEPQDVDDNDYVDIAVGAFHSSNVVLLRSQPVVTIKVQFSEEGMVKLQSDTTWFNVKVCSMYEGIRIPEKLDVEITLKVDSQRAFYGGTSNANGVYKITRSVITNQLDCTLYNMTLVKDNIKDPIEVSVSSALVPPSSEKFCATCPVVNELKSKLNASIMLNFALKCGFDNECVANIEMQMDAHPGDLENGDRYTLGSKTDVRLRVRVENTGEPAYNAKLHVFIPSPVFLRRTPLTCESFPSNGPLEVICPLGNPLEKSSLSPIEIVFPLDMSAVHSDTEYIELSANVSTQSKNAKEASNNLKFIIYFDVDVNMAITGKSLQDTYSFDNEGEGQGMESIRYRQIYIVQNTGKSPIEESNVTIWVPTHLRENNIEVARIIEYFGVMDDQPITCRILGTEQEGEFIKGTEDDRTVQESSTTELFNLHMPPEHRTLYLDCTYHAVKCVQISCKLNKFADSNTFAKITITLNLQTQNFGPLVMKTKDIVYFKLNASVSAMTRSGGIHQRFESTFNSTSGGTIFLGSPIALPVSTWIIVVSFVFGVLLLVLLILGLIKLGFFRRQKKEDLEALIADDDNSQCFVLETSSSREVLDAI